MAEGDYVDEPACASCGFNESFTGSLRDSHYYGQPRRDLPVKVCRLCEITDARRALLDYSQQYSHETGQTLRVVIAVGHLILRALKAQ
jgi:hypothetical protein